MRFRSAYDGLNDEVSIVTGSENNEPTMTQQHDADETDINTIVKKFKVTGVLPQGIRVPSYGDFTDGISDFRTAMEAIRAASESFMALPGEVRARFGNDPQAFLEFCSDENNIDQMREMGLAVPKAEPPVELIQKVQVVNPDPA